MPLHLKSCACVHAWGWAVSWKQLSGFCKQITQWSCHGSGFQDWREIVFSTGYKHITIDYTAASCRLPFTHILVLVSWYKPEGETLHLCLLSKEARVSLSLFLSDVSWWVFSGQDLQTLAIVSCCRPPDSCCLWQRVCQALPSSRNRCGEHMYFFFCGLTISALLLCGSAKGD